MKIIVGYEAVKDRLSRQVVQQRTGRDEREAAVLEIIDNVRKRGDDALYEYTEKFDGVRLKSLEIGQAEIQKASREIDKDVLSALKLAAERITTFHQEQKERLFRESTGGNLGWLLRPLGRIGIYAPGSRAPLPSTVLMTAIPARVAGVKEIILVTPPAYQGGISPLTLAAAEIVGIDRVFTVGGAQAIAALAFGTETVPRVDKVCGPGPIWVFLAKKLLYGVVGIDGLYGPSEVIIVADGKANPEYCAADLLAQAEHDALATAILLTTSRRLAEKVSGELEQQLKTLEYRDAAEKSLAERGMIGVVKTVEEAIELSNLYAPEHLCLVVKNADNYIDEVKNAGCLFVGENAVEVLVDYVAGPSHVLPTEGTARFGSPLNVLDFVKLTSLVKTDERDIRRLGKAASIIARAEGLEAHARAIEKRMNKQNRGV